MHLISFAHRARTFQLRHCSRVGSSASIVAGWPRNGKTPKSRTIMVHRFDITPCEDLDVALRSMFSRCTNCWYKSRSRVTIRQSLSLSPRHTLCVALFSLRTRVLSGRREELDLRRDIFAYIIESDRIKHSCINYPLCSKSSNVLSMNRWQLIQS